MQSRRIVEAYYSHIVIKMKTNLEEHIPIPEGVEITAGTGTIKAKGPKGEIVKDVKCPNVNIAVKEGDVVVESKKATKREKRLIGTVKSHINNMIQGVTEGHIYRLKVCSTHFPMNASVNNSEFTVQNFLGEKVARTCRLQPDVSVKIEGAEIIVESPNKEHAGQAAAAMEQLCRITNRDKRIFQDGIYITEKSRKSQK